MKIEINSAIVEHLVPSCVEILNSWSRNVKSKKPTFLRQPQEPQQKSSQPTFLPVNHNNNNNPVTPQAIPPDT
jgi:hypothetical protein